MSDSLPNDERVKEIIAKALEIGVIDNDLANDLRKESPGEALKALSAILALKGYSLRRLFPE
ncbi:MAG TPA: hypothetical protein VLG36_01450 [Candidatus Chromulinivoraceae bacterium]|nr:hypothetical protein [Candidatus Chromulinivoraceae bacterium]